MRLRLSAIHLEPFQSWDPTLDDLSHYSCRVLLGKDRALICPSTGQHKPLYHCTSEIPIKLASKTSRGTGAHANPKKECGELVNAFLYPLFLFYNLQKFWPVLFTTGLEFGEKAAKNIHVTYRLVVTNSGLMLPESVD